VKKINVLCRRVRPNRPLIINLWVVMGGGGFKPEDKEISWSETSVTTYKTAR
jgi:hypothetical protein